MAVNQATYAAQMTAQIQSVNAVISSIGALATAPPVILQTLYTAVQSALVPYQNAIAAIDADIDITSVGRVTAGGFGPVLATSLLVQASDVAQQAILIVAEAYLTRVGINCLNAPG